VNIAREHRTRNGRATDAHFGATGLIASHQQRGAPVNRGRDRYVARHNLCTSRQHALQTPSELARTLADSKQSQAAGYMTGHHPCLPASNEAICSAGTAGFLDNANNRRVLCSRADSWGR
jgi:hypothetical protein